MPTFVFAVKPRQKFIRTEVVPTFIFAVKPRQHFIRTKAVPTFIFVMKPQQHSTLALALTLKLHQYWPL